MVGSLIEIRRYLVKSMAGESLESSEVDERGLVGDRSWAIADADGRFGSAKTTRRFRKMAGLLHLSATGGPGGVPLVGFPDGRTYEATDPVGDEALSAYVGLPVRLQPEAAVSHFDEGPIHLVTTASLEAVSEHHHAEVDLARLRGNLVVAVEEQPGFVEDAWIGGTLAIGPEVRIRVRDPMPRCVMVDEPQRGLPAAAGLLDTLGQLNGSCVGVVADVVTPGRIHLGDPVRTGVA